MSGRSGEGDPARQTGRQPADSLAASRQQTAWQTADSLATDFIKMKSVQRYRYG